MAQQALPYGAVDNDPNPANRIANRTAWQRTAEMFTDIYALQSQIISAGDVRFASQPTTEAKIQAAINQAVVELATIVFIPAFMLPYDSSLVTFNTGIRMVREGGNFTLYDVQAYGADPLGVQVSKIAIQGAVAGAIAAGGGTISFTGGAFNVGDLTANEVAFDILPGDASNLSFVGPATLNCHTVSGGTGIFRLYNPENVLFQNLLFHDSGTDLTANNDFGYGTIAIRLIGYGAAAFHSGIRIVGCETTAVWAFLACGSGVTAADDTEARIRDIYISGCVVRNSYYGVLCQTNGDGLRGDWRCEHVRRGYFPQGVSDHDVSISAYHAGVLDGANTFALIKRYSRNNKNIRVRIAFFGSALKYANAVTLEHQPYSGTGTSVLEDIEVDLHISEDIASPNSMNSLLLRSYTEAGVEETTTTANRWDRISFRGTVGVGNIIPVIIRCTQAVEGRLVLDPSIYRAGSQPHYPGFVVRVAHDREIRTLKGDLTAQTLVIPMAWSNGLPFTLCVRTFMHDDITGLVAQNTTYEEDVLIGYNASAGAVGIQSTTQLHKVSQGTAGTITFTASGENINVTFAGAPYNTANGFARVETQFVGRGPIYA